MIATKRPVWMWCMALGAAGCGGGAAATSWSSEARGGASDSDSGGEVAMSAHAYAPAYASSTAATVVTGAGVAVVTTRPGVVVRQGSRPEAQYAIPAGLLTAASVGDVDRRSTYIEYLERRATERSVLSVDMTRRVRFKVVDSRGRPVDDAAITVRGAHVGRTHADGIWDFFPSVADPQASGPTPVTIDAGQLHVETTANVSPTSDSGDITVRLDGYGAASPAKLDLAFLIDATGSMEDEIRYVNREIADIVGRIHAGLPQVHVRVGATFYRDRCDPVLVQQIALTDDVPSFAAAMQSVNAYGGGDYAEDMHAGLESALHDLAWERGQAVRVLVLIADAPPQSYAGTAFGHREAMLEAAARGIRILPVAASGADRETEYLMRAMGAFTSTPYTYLTDDSGVGAGHMDADTDRVGVERFNALLVRMVLADLAGDGMHEPGAFGPRLGQNGGS